MATVTENNAASSAAGRARALPFWPETNLDQFPGDDGWPMFGHTFSFSFNTNALIEHMQSKYGRNFRAMLFGAPAIILGNPDDVRTMLLDKQQNFSSRVGWHNAIGQLFSNGLMLRDFEEHRVHRRIMMSAFRTEAMRGYVDLMNPLITKGLDRWEEKIQRKPTIKFYPRIKKLTLDLAAEVFLGLPLGEEANQINRAFVDSVKASIAIVKKEVPLLSYKRGMDGRRFLEGFISNLIPQRRGKDGSDMFSQFCSATSEDGEQFSDDEIVDHMIFLLMAAHDTTTSSATSLIWSLAQYPEWQESLRAEIGRLPAGALQFDDRNKLELCDLAFKEALRMYPPVPFIPRRSIEACELGGVRLPRNSSVMAVSLITHFLDEYWTEPRKFDPERFSPDRAEDKRHSHCYFPFGGGAHTCIGMQFAIIQVKAFLVQFLRRYRVHLIPGQREVMRPIPIPNPKHGLKVRLERIAD